METDWLTIEEKSSLFDLMWNGSSEPMILAQRVFNNNDKDYVVGYIILRVNAPFEEQSGLGQDEVIGRRVAEVLPYFDPLWLEEYGGVGGPHKTFQAVVRNFAADGWSNVRVFSLSAEKLLVTISNLKSEPEREHLALLAELRRKELELSEAQRIGHIGNWYWIPAIDRDENHLSEELHRIFGYEPTQPLPPFHLAKGALLPSDSWNSINQAIEETLRTGAGFEMDTKALRADGSPIWVTIRAEVLRDKHGKIIGLRGTNQDITQRKQAEAELLKVNRRERLLSTVACRLLTNDDPQGIIDDLCRETMDYLQCEVFLNYLADRELGCLHLNAWAGIPREEAFKIEWLDYGAGICGSVARDGSCIVIENIDAVIDPRTELIRALGVKAYACNPLIIEQEVIGTISFGSRTRESFTPEELSLMTTVAGHISIAIGRLLANQQLRKNEQRLELLVQERTRELEESNQAFAKTLESITDAFFTLDRDWRVTYWNGAAEHLFNVTRQEVIGRIFWEVFPDSIGSEIYYQYQWAMLYNVPVFFVTQADHSDLWVEARAYPSPSGLTIYLHDITKRKLAQDELRNSEERFYKIFDNNPDLIAILRLKDNMFIDVNQRFLSLTGYSREEVIGKTPEKLNLYDENQSLLDSALIELKTKGEIHNVEYRLSTKSGNIVTVSASIVIMNLNGELCRVALMRDLTREKLMEAEIARLDRLNLIGEMAASIGHEIRNPMTAVRGFLQMLGEKEEYSEDQAFFDLMIEELDRANEIITEYLGMAKNKKISLLPRCLDEIVNSLCPMIQPTVTKRDMNLKLELTEPPPCLVDENEIRQLILNMVHNGLEAMDPKGTLTIGTTSEDDDIVLYIKDQGHGLDQDIMDKLGTPFLTTKDKGTGLGLAVCYSIAARHKARIDVTTGSTGTTFYIKFPIAAEQALLL